MRSNTQAADGDRRAVVARRAVFRFVSPILALLLVSLLAAVVSLELLSTIRAYVGGEGLYSKRQKAATQLKKADIAMYRAKAAGRNKFQFFSKEMTAHSVERLTLENELRHAVTQRQFAIHYQPKVNFSPAVPAAEFLQLLLADVERAPGSSATVEPVVVDDSAALGRASARRGRRP